MYLIYMANETFDTEIQKALNKYFLLEIAFYILTYEHRLNAIQLYKESQKSKNA